MMALNNKFVDKLLINRISELINLQIKCHAPEKCAHLLIEDYKVTIKAWQR